MGILRVSQNRLVTSFGIGQPALNLVNHLDQTGSRRLDRQQETDADVFGVELLFACYGHADGARTFLATLRNHDCVQPTGGLGYLSTHPATDDRLGAIQGLKPEED